MLPKVRVSNDGVFYTLQGEGVRLGMPSVFVRLDVCNLKCKWGDVLCDAHYTSWTPGDREDSGEDFLRNLKDVLRQHKCCDVVITGGEPTLQPDVIRMMTHDVDLSDVFFSIETNGTRYVEDHRLNLVCISPKLHSSVPVGTKYEKAHARNRWNPEEVLKWMNHSQEYFFKFVIDTPDDLNEVIAMCLDVGQQLEPEHVIFMPQGIDATTLWARSRWLAEECKRLGVRFTPRIQVDLWGNQPGT